MTTTVVTPEDNVKKNGEETDNGTAPKDIKPEDVTPEDSKKDKVNPSVLDLTNTFVWTDSLQ